tara:strand:+ start:9002 stop:9232 length:231 start_codon:yes stop_codon:yes gene_type:complete
MTIKSLTWNADASWVLVKGDNLSRSAIRGYFRKNFSGYSIKEFKGMETTTWSNGMPQECATTDYCRDNWLLYLGAK